MSLLCADFVCEADIRLDSGRLERDLQRKQTVNKKQNRNREKPGVLQRRGGSGSRVGL